MKFTFKKHKKEGRFKSFELDGTDIKLKKKVVGLINETRDYHKYRVQFAVKREKTEDSPAPFKWVTLKKIFIDEEEARKMLIENTDSLCSQFDFYRFED